MRTSEIQNYIEQLGGGLESGGEGRFTVDKLSRSQQLLESASQFPFRWLYFAVQAAVSAGAEAVRVGSNTHCLSLEFQLGDEPSEFLSLDWLPVESAYSKPSMRFWSQATLWASALSPTVVQILCQGRQGGYLISLQGETVQKQTLPAQNRRTRAAILVNFSNKPQQRIQLSAYLSKCLARELAYVAVPLRLEGSEGALGYPVYTNYRRVALALAGPGEFPVLGFIYPSHLNFGEYRLANRRGFLFEDSTPESAQLDLSGAVGSRAAIRVQGEADWNHLNLRADSNGRWLLPLDYAPNIPGTSRIRCRSIAFYRPDRPSRLYPVHQGLSLLPVHLPEAPSGWDIFWPTPDQATDYFGLSAVQDDHLTEHRRQAVSWISTRHI